MMRWLFDAKKWLGFSTDFDVRQWQPPFSPNSLAEKVSNETDRLLCRALFTAGQAMSAQQEAHTSGTVAAFQWKTALQDMRDTDFLQVMGTDGPIILCGSLCDPTFAAALTPVARRLHQVFPERQVSALLLGAVYAGDDTSLMRVTLEHAHVEDCFHATALVSLPEDCVSKTEGAANLAHLAMVHCLISILRGASGPLGFAVDAGNLSWQDFGAEGAAW